MSRELQVWLDQIRIGTLLENMGIWSLQYDPTWVSEGFPLSPRLPLQAAEIQDTGTLRPVQWFFDNLLPEEMARTRLIAELPKGDWDSWNLLARFGGESAGALTLLIPGVELAAPGLSPLSDEELNHRIVNMSRIPLGATAPKKMSLAGAQEKLPVVMGPNGALFDPLGAQVSTHILKPNALSNFYPASAVNEWFCARVAQELQLSVPPVQLRHVPEAVYLIERFDRETREGQLQRRHTLDATQLLNLAAGAKYARSGAEALSAIADLSRTPAPARIALFRWALFNVLIGNGDAHLKNLSFLADRDGCRLAPHYDLVSTAAWATLDLGATVRTWPDVELSFPIGEATTFLQVRTEHFLQFAETLGLPAQVAEHNITRLVKGISEAADRVIVEHTQLTIPDAHRAAEIRMLRAIRYLPIADMARQLIPSK
ncbi:MAG: type II toxin-antitoxin system HipA family toxin [Rhodocyclaceae bacterium]|nr:MAG: type II toxin-antitoxin system HipA family toxin [Rhodocyclaceae bacterium]